MLFVNYSKTHEFERKHESGGKNYFSSPGSEDITLHYMVQCNSSNDTYMNHNKYQMEARKKLKAY